MPFSQRGTRAVANRGISGPIATGASADSTALPPLVPADSSLNGLSGKGDGNGLRFGKRNNGWRYGYEVVYFLDWQSIEINPGHWHGYPARFGKQQIDTDHMSPLRFAAVRCGALGAASLFLPLRGVTVLVPTGEVEIHG